MKMALLPMLALAASALSLDAGNPIIKDRFTADAAALVHDDTVYLYVGHDEATPEGDFFVMNEWLIYSSNDMLQWSLEGSLPRSAFSWARRPTAWAAQAIERNGAFYWYVTVLNDAPDHPDQNGFAIGVAVSDHPVHGFRDALGGPLVRSDMTQAPEHMHDHETWDNIDPSVYIDDDGQAYLYWGNSHLYYAKLKDNMIELDGPIHQLSIQDMPGTFTEAPWIHKYKDTYYLSFAMNYPEQIAYATSDSITGPWVYGGLVLDLLPDTGTSHQAIIEFRGQWYFFYHTAALPTGANFRRSVSVERLHHEADGSIRPILATASGLAFSPFHLTSAAQPGHFLRHAERGLRLEPKQEEEAYDFLWHIVPGLADGSDESCISLQAENLPGFYLLISDTGQLSLSKHDGRETFKEGATFRTTPGLSDATATSLQAFGDATLFLTLQEDGALRMAQPKQGERPQATFAILPVED